MLTIFYEIIKLIILVLKSPMYDFGHTICVTFVEICVTTLSIYLKSNFKGASNFLKQVVFFPHKTAYIMIKP